MAAIFSCLTVLKLGVPAQSAMISSAAKEKKQHLATKDI